MRIDRKWVERNLGFDPIKTPAPDSTFTLRKAARSRSVEDLQREIIDFDSEAPEGREFLAFTTATGLSRFTDVPWPSKLKPVTDGTARTGSAGELPTADVLVVTWTVDEGHALSRVLTPGKDSKNDYLSYTHNFASISRKMRAGCPALQAQRLGAYWTIKIADKRVVVFKSDSHMSQDGPQLPNIDVWAQIISEVQPKLVITTGTAGGIGTQFEVGDVVVSPIVRFDCTAKFKKEPFAQDALFERCAKVQILRHGEKAFQGERRTTAEGQYPSAKDCLGIAHRAGVLGRDDGLLRIRYLGQSLQTARAGRCIRNGRRRARARRESDGKQSASLDCGAQCFGPADQSRGNAQRTGRAGGPDL